MKLFKQDNNFVKTCPFRNERFLCNVSVFRLCLRDILNDLYIFMGSFLLYQHLSSINGFLLYRLTFPQIAVI